MDYKKIKEQVMGIEKNSLTINNIVDEVVTSHTAELDSYIDNLRDILELSQTEITDEKLNEVILRLPIYIYYLSEIQEDMGIREDIAKTIRQDNYSRVYSETRGTVGDKTNKAELAVQEDTLVHIIHQRMYKEIKAKAEAADELLQSCKKILTRRIAEIEIGTRSGGF